jgi:hypothetical protein
MKRLNNLLIACAVVQIIICGDGADKKSLLQLGLGVPNLSFKGTLEIKDYREMLADADLMVVSLVSGSGNSFFPSKLLSACAAGKPVMAICDSDSELAYCGPNKPLRLRRSAR